MPSTYEVHYPEGLKDSAVFVNYNLSADSSCNFYMKYKLFFQLYKKKGIESAYQYYLQHPEIKQSQADYKGYKLLGFYYNNNSDTARYYESNYSSEGHQEEKYLKPTIPYHQPARPYYHIKTK
ncbi:MAG: hypothetical protein HYZ42_18315 [Bacteroidetes bacterium]|nr:hypothetical protein [Bacteroidota bacterium]